MNAIASQPKRALILIDVQNEYFTGNLPIEYPDVNVSLANIAKAAEGAVRAGIPIVVVQQTSPVDSPIFAEGSPGWQLHEMVAKLPRSHYVRKPMASVLTGTGLQDWLRARDIDTLVLAGYMIHNCNDATARQAVHEGWAVELLDDATGAVSYANRAGYASAKDIYDVYRVVLQSRFAAVMSTQEWLDMIAKGTAPERDSIYDSSQRALKAKAA